MLSIKNLQTVFVLLSVCILIFSANVRGGSITYTVNNENFEGYFVKRSNNAPCILLVHDWDGLTEYERKRADMLHDEGYTVFAVDLFGAGVRPTTEEGRREATDRLYRDRERMRNLLYRSLQAAQSKGADINNTVAVGYCFGGTAVLELARSGANLKGFVIFHGGLTTPEGQDYAKTKGALLVLHGTADKSITMEHFAALAAQLEAKGIPHEMITYGKAPHAFSVFGSERYRQDADVKSWKRFKDFLKETLKR